MLHKIAKVVNKQYVEEVVDKGPSHAEPRESESLSAADNSMFMSKTMSVYNLSEPRGMRLA